MHSCNEAVKKIVDAVEKTGTYMKISPELQADMHQSMVFLHSTEIKNSSVS